MASLEEKIVVEGIESLGRYYSNYRARVVNNDDPDDLNRVKVAIPGINGGIILWAYPKGQHGGNQNGFKYLPPKIGDTVWVSFEQGDPSLPLWEYHSWAGEETPDDLKGPNRMGFVTPNGTYVILDDELGAIDIYLSEHRGSDYGTINIWAPNDINLMSKTKININGGNNGGVIKIQELTDKLNKLVNEVDNLRQTFNTHTHKGVQPGPSATAPTDTMVTSPISQFNIPDYENQTFNH